MSNRFANGIPDDWRDLLVDKLDKTLDEIGTSVETIPDLLDELARRSQPNLAEWLAAEEAVTCNLALLTAGSAAAILAAVESAGLELPSEFGDDVEEALWWAGQDPAQWLIAEQIRQELRDGEMQALLGGQLLRWTASQAVVAAVQRINAVSSVLLQTMLESR